MSAFQRPIFSCVLLLSPEEDKGMDMQSPQDLLESLRALGLGQEMSNLQVGCKSISFLSLRNMNNRGVRQWFYSDGSIKTDFFQKRPV